MGLRFHQLVEFFLVWVFLLVVGVFLLVVGVLLLMVGVFLLDYLMGRLLFCPLWFTVLNHYFVILYLNHGLLRWWWLETKIVRDFLVLFHFLLWQHIKYRFRLRIIRMSLRLFQRYFLLLYLWMSLFGIRTLDTLDRLIVVSHQSVLGFPTHTILQHTDPLQL